MAITPKSGCGTVIAVLGAGAWGTALAWRLAANGHHVQLWVRDAAAAGRMREARENTRYLPGVRLPPLLETTHDHRQALAYADDILLATPSHAFEDVLRLVAGVCNPSRLAWATKGFQHGSARLLHCLVEDCFGDGCARAVLSGPTFAAEVARALPTAVTVAASTEAFAHRLQQLFQAGTFRVYASDDIAGVEIGGALKNVLAIAVGISDGLGFGANARAALIARGLQEVYKVAQVYGGRSETLMGLAGLGDLVLTCTDDQSRNRRFGLLVGGGRSPSEAKAELGLLVEGTACAREVERIAAERGLDLPIMGAVADVVAGRAQPMQAVQRLLARQVKSNF